jgi:cold shock CspA family protein
LLPAILASAARNARESPNGNRTVRWFRDGKRLKLSAPDDQVKDLFVRQSAAARSGRRSPPEVAGVSYEAQFGDKGLTAVNVHAGSS